MGTSDWLLMLLLPEPESPDMSRTSLLALRSLRTSSFKNTKSKITLKQANLNLALKIICAKPEFHRASTDLSATLQGIVMGLLKSAGA